MGLVQCEHHCKKNVRMRLHGIVTDELFSYLQPIFSLTSLRYIQKHHSVTIYIERLLGFMLDKHLFLAKFKDYLNIFSIKNHIFLIFLVMEPAFKYDLLIWSSTLG